MALALSGKDGFYGWVNLAVMFFFNIAFMLMVMSFALFLPFWVGEFSWGRGLASGAQTLGMILSGIAAPMVGIFIMKQGAKRAIVIGNLLNAAGLVLLAFMDRLWHLYLGFGVIVGLGMAIGGMLAMMTIVNNWFILKRPAALSVAMASMGFSGIVFNPLLMRLITTLGWRHTYLLIAAAVAVFCVVVPALLVVNRPEQLGQVPDGPHALQARKAASAGPADGNPYKTPVDFTAGEAMKTRTMWLLIGYGTLQFMVMGSLLTHQIAFLFDIGIPGTLAAMAAGIFGAVMGVSQLGVGFLGLRVNMHRLAILSVIIGIAGYGTLLSAESLAAVILYNILLGCGFGIQSIAMGNLIPDYFGRTEFPRMMGYSMPFTTILASFGAPVAGYIRDATGSYIPAFQASLVLMAASFFCILFARPPVHPSLKRGLHAAP